MENNSLTTTEGGRAVAGNRHPEATDTPGQESTTNLSAENQLFSEYEWIFGGKVEKERCGAYGVFTVTNDLTRYTKASLFSRTGKKTHIFLTFSEAAKYAEDESIGRHVCVYSIKFYTEDGIWDLIGCNHPVSFTCHPQKYLDYIYPKRLIAENKKFSLIDKWNIWSLLPDSLHQIMFLMGDRGLPHDYRHMHGFGCRTYSFLNKDNRHFFVKFHLLTQQGILNLTMQEAWKRRAGNRKFAQRDLYDNIKKGNYPKWKMYIQVMTDEDVEKCTFNPFDPTKVWPHGQYPLIEAGTLELQRNPAHNSMEVRYSDFSPSNVVEGIGLPGHTAKHKGKSDYYIQPGAFFRLQCAEAQQRLIHNVAVELAQIPQHLRIVAAARFYQADQECGEKIAKELRLGINSVLEEVKKQKEAEMKMTFRMYH